MRLRSTINALKGITAMLLLSFAAVGCSRPAYGADDLPMPAIDLPSAKESATRTAVFAGGCFWCTEAVFEQLDGVSDVVSGYAGGTEQSADYKKVSEGKTDHAESIQVTYDPSRITYGQLLRVFFATHDPTTKDRQGPDWGRQYRSAIFYADEDEKRVAAAYIRQLEDAKIFSAAIVTTLERLDRFYAAEEDHQDYVNRNPRDPYVQQWAIPKVAKLREKFNEQLKSTTQPAR